MKKCKLILPLLLLLATLCLLAACSPSTDTPNGEKIKIEGITFPDKSFKYDGKTAYSLSIIGELPEGVTVKYTGNGQVEYGTYTVYVVFVASEGYEDIYELPETMKATMTIDYVDIREMIRGIGFIGSTVLYDGNPHGIEISGTLPEGVKVEYDNNYQTDVGEYEVTARFTYTEEAAKKYKPLANLTATLTIAPQTYSMVDIEFSDTAVEYDGMPKVLLLIGELADTLTPHYSYTDAAGTVYSDRDEAGHPVENFGPTEIGDYIFTVTFENTAVGCIAPDPMTATLSIVERAAKITFMEGEEVNTVISVPFNTPFDPSRLPTPKSEELGYTFTWESFDMTSITEDITVNLVKTAIVYHLTYQLDSGLTAPSGLPTTYTVEDLPLAIPTVESNTTPYAWRILGSSLGLIAVLDEGTTGDLTLIAASAEATLGIVYEVGETGVTIKEYQGDSSYIFLPETYEGKPIVKIASNAFRGKAIKYIKLPHTVTEIGNNAFADCTELATVEFSKVLKNIGGKAFYGCTSLTEITLPDSLTSVGQGVFEKTNLTAITLPFIGSSANGVAAKGYFGYLFGASSHGQNSFYVPETLKTVTVSKYCTRIEANAFDGLVHLERVIMESDGTLGVRVISNEAFRGCTGLLEVEIAATVLEIPANAEAANSPFIGCSSSLVIKLHCTESFAAQVFGQYFANISETEKAQITYLG